MADSMDVDNQAGGQGGGGESKHNAMIHVNNLTYTLDPDLSVAVNNTHKNHFFQQTAYTNQQRAICILNSGADYIDTTRSFLSFRVAATCATNNTAAWFGENGSALNLINRITISSRSGDELSRVRSLNLLAASRLPYQMDKAWARTTGEMAGFGKQFTCSAAAPGAGDGLIVNIPLYLLSDFFGYNRLMPAMLMSGLRIEIEWEEPSVAFTTLTTATNSGEPGIAADALDLNVKAPVNTAITSYQVDNIFISAKSVQLTDATQRALNEMSAVNGLEIVYTDWETTQLDINANSINMEVRKASSRALAALMRVRPAIPLQTDATLYTNPIAESFASEGWDFTQYQWQLGSLYFPQQPIKSRTPAAAGSCPEAYAHALDCFDKLQPNSRPPLCRLYADTTSGLGTLMYERKAFTSGASTIGVTLERSSLFQLSGIPINNSRVLSFQGTFANSRNRNVTIFLKYVKLARVFLNNVEVEM